MNRKVALLLSLCCAFSLVSSAQVGKAYLGLTVSSEFDLMSRNSPYGLQACTRLGPIYLQGEYKIDEPKITNVQVLGQTQSYGGRAGFFVTPGSAAAAVGFHGGVLFRDEYKAIHFDVDEYPLDQSGNPVIIDKAQIALTGQTYVAGLTILVVSVDDGEKISALVDDFDLKILKKRKRYSTIMMTLEAMLQPSVTYDRTFIYNPWNYYVDRRVTIQPELRQRKLGFNFRLEFTGPLHIGGMFSMGILPGISNKTDSYNDFNFAVRAGLLVNMGIFKKQQ